MVPSFEHLRRGLICQLTSYLPKGLTGLGIVDLNQFWVWDRMGGIFKILASLHWLSFQSHKWVEFLQDLGRYAD